MKIWQKALAAMMAIGLVVSSAACSIPGAGAGSSTAAGGNSSTTSTGNSSNSSTGAAGNLAEKQTYFGGIKTTLAELEYFKLSNFDYAYTYTPSGALEPSTAYFIDGNLTYAERFYAGKTIAEFELNVSINEVLDATIYLVENNLYSVSQSNYKDYGSADGYSLAELVEGVLIDLGANENAAKIYATQMLIPADFNQLGSFSNNEVENAANIVNEEFVLKYTNTQGVNDSVNATWMENPDYASCSSLLAKQVNGTLTAADLAAYLAFNSNASADAATFTQVNTSLTALNDQRYDRSIIKSVDVVVDLAVQNIAEAGSSTAAKLIYNMLLPYGLNNVKPTISIPTGVTWTEGVLPF